MSTMEKGWSHCSQKCFLFQININSSLPGVPFVNSTLYNATHCVNKTFTFVANETHTFLLNCSLTRKSFNSPSGEYWENNVLHLTDGIGEAGPLRWQLVICLILAWILVYFCLWKGIKSSGKVVYFTATFPYVILVVLFFRGITLEGASKGITYYIQPDFNKLADADVWVAAATQIFYSLGIGFGSLVTFGSFNQYNNDCVRCVHTYSKLEPTFGVQDGGTSGTKKQQQTFQT